MNVDTIIKPLENFVFIRFDIFIIEKYIAGAWKLNNGGNMHKSFEFAKRFQ